VCGIGGSLLREKVWMSAFCGLFAVAPMVTAANYFRELAFAWYWGNKNRPVEPAGISEAVL
jgi:hypothetical protein